MPLSPQFSAGYPEGCLTTITISRISNSSKDVETCGRISMTSPIPREKKNTPKFASFSGIRPRQTIPAARNREESSDLGSENRDVLAQNFSGLPPNHRDHHVHKRHRRRHRERSVGNETVGVAAEHTGGPADADKEEDVHSYVSDRTGDPDNLVFGALHRYATPSYFRFGRGKVLGPLAGRKIDRASSTEKCVVLAYNDGSQWNQRDRRALWDAVKHEGSKVQDKPYTSKSWIHDFDANFVSLQAPQRVKRRRGNGSSASEPEDSSESGGERTHHRFLGGIQRAETSLEEKDPHYASDVSEAASGKENWAPSMEKVFLDQWARLSRQVDLDSTNYSTWLDLIKHQEKILGTMTDATQKSNAHIKLSLYEKAVNSVKDPFGREILLLGKMSEAAKVWDDRKLSSEWQLLLRENPTCFMLWKAYLNYRQSAFALFRYEEIQKVYSDCFDLLHDVRSAPNISYAEEDRMYNIQIYVVLRMTLFMRESGFTEHAVAIWQALLEYEYLRPSNFHASNIKIGDGSLRHTVSSSFEDFWDSEVPRIGEERSEGWRKFHEARGDLPHPRTETVAHSLDTRKIWNSWLCSERTQSAMARLPARTIDDAVEDDPYRVILFSDIRLFLIDSPSAASSFTCLDGFLEFCHLPPCHEVSIDGNSRCWWREGYLRNENLGLSHSTLRPQEPQSTQQGVNEALASNIETKYAKRNISNLPMAEYQPSPETLFAETGTWFSVFDSWCSTMSEEGGPFDKSWVLRSLRQLALAGVGEDSLVEYCLALELALFPATVKKTARSLLKKGPSSLRLYAAYALIESRLGSPSNGENTLLTSIKLGKTIDEGTRTIEIWRTWLWQRLTSGDPQGAFEIAVRYGAEGEDILPNPSNAHNVQPALLLRAERALQTTRDHLLSLSHYRLAAFAIDCLILFHYLKDGSSLPSASSAFKANCLHLNTYPAPTKTTLEFLHQSFARLLHHHVTHTKLVKPSDIRSLLTESIKLFPQNTIFLSLYAWNEARFRIDDRVRSIVKDVIMSGNQDAGPHQHQESVIPHFFAVHAEMNRGVALGSNVSTIRSTFERAVGSDGGAHCAGLWKMYFLFEHERGDMGRAKNVFWRAIRACPWAKDLYMLAFEYLNGAGGFGDGDLRGVYELMSQKEFRIHVSLEEFFDEIDERKKISQSQR